MNRFCGFDYLRAVGVFAVVYIHGCDTNEFARYHMKWAAFAVPCFFMMSAFLAQTSLLKKEETYKDFVGKRFLRLAPPFLFWSLIYSIVRIGKSRIQSQEIDLSLTGAVFWGDASHHLYFVPLLFYFFVVFAPVMIFARTRPRTACAICLTVVILDLIGKGWVAEQLPPKRWFIAGNLCWFPLGMMFAQAHKALGNRMRYLLWPAALSLFSILAMNFLNVYIFACSAMILALALGDFQTPPWVTFLAKYSFGVYLVHVLIVEAVQFAAPALGIATSSVEFTFALILSCYVASYVICLTFGNNSRTSFAVT